MTKYEYLMGKAEEAELRCRESRDSYVKTFWARTADQYAKMSRRLDVSEASEQIPPSGAADGCERHEDGRFYL